MPPSAYDKDETLRLLKSKAMLLMRREKELFELTQERDRVATWLGVFYALSEMLADDAALDAMAAAARKLGRPDAAARIAALVMDLLGGSGKEPAR